MIKDRKVDCFISYMETSPKKYKYTYKIAEIIYQNGQREYLIDINTNVKNAVNSFTFTDVFFPVEARVITKISKKTYNTLRKLDNAVKCYFIDDIQTHIKDKIYANS